MAELNLNQITEKLNTEFTGETRKLIFWYDVNAEFAEDIDSLQLSNASVLHLEKDNQFYIKHFLECEDRENNYLVYAPFARPPVRENHLEDTIRYSKEFFADRASLVALDLGIDERYKPVIQKYIKFFASKERMKKFYDLEIEVYDENIIKSALMSVLCKSKIPSTEEVLRCILTDDDIDDSRYLAEFEKYDLLEAFWQQIYDVFGYQSDSPTLEKLMMTMFITYTMREIHKEIPDSWQPFVSHKSGNIIAFLDNMMNSYLYGECFDEISHRIFRAVNGDKILADMEPEDIAGCYIFAGADSLITDWIIDRLKHEDVAASLGDMSIPQLCRQRSKGHFGSMIKEEYVCLENAWNLISAGEYQPVTGAGEILKNYIRDGYKLDRSYRLFCESFDRIEDNTRYEELCRLIENIYAGKYMGSQAVNWSKELAEQNLKLDITRQNRFFDRYVNNIQERVVVIISDAMRYEVGHELFERLQEDEKCTVSIEPMQSMLPSYTVMGMAALLPHKTLSMTENYRILVDDKPVNTLKQREDILRSYISDSRCIQYDEIRSMKREALRKIFTGQDTVYIYHNQIDARGDKIVTENEVFTACREAVDEIHKLIRDLSAKANTIRFIVTADHGFLYKRDKLSESDKIGSSVDKDSLTGRRYVVSAGGIESEGVINIPFSMMLKDDDRILSLPMGNDVFKVPGSGFNYVHGGGSLQEMIVPVIDVKTEKGKTETYGAQIALISSLKKLTNLIISLDFVQTEPVGDTVKEAAYKLYFISEDGESISNEVIYVADHREKETAKRVLKAKFRLKNRKYDNSRKYFLVAEDRDSNMEIWRHEVMIDIALADDFGF